MQFNSFQYIIYLFGVTVLYYLLPLDARKVLLLAASFVFYAAWNARYLLLMLAVIGVTYAAALCIVKYPRRKKPVFAACLAAVLALLFYFKYLNFVIETVNTLFRSRFALWEILLPVGISFYVFQSLGYVIDVYQDADACEKSLLNYALFISFFPQLVAGPIERSSNMLAQFNTLQKFRIENIKNGLTLILIGLVQKVVIADRLAVFVTGVFDGYQNAGRFALVLAAVFFAFQVYCDFGAYSLIAVGSAKLMGYRLMQNFNHPYLSRSFAEYWSRWHISLSSWFQDYIFTPFVWANPLKKLGRQFAKPPMRVGLLLVFFVSGLWHGANWTFVVWGLLHAGFRIFEASTQKARKRFYKKLSGPKGGAGPAGERHAGGGPGKGGPAGERLDGRGPAGAGAGFSDAGRAGVRLANAGLAVAEVLAVFALNCVTYVFFRADSLGAAAAYLRRIVTGAGAGAEILPLDAFGLARGELILSALLIAGLVLCDIIGEYRHKNCPADEIIDAKPVFCQGAIYAGLLLLLVVCGTYGAAYVENPFVYFQF